MRAKSRTIFTLYQLVDWNENLLLTASSALHVELIRNEEKESSESRPKNLPPLSRSTTNIYS